MKRPNEIGRKKDIKRGREKVGDVVRGKEEEIGWESFRKREKKEKDEK